MRRWLINADEDEALQGLPHMAQIAYMRAIRPYMDAESGLVGIKRGVSRQSIAETLEVEARPGRAHVSVNVKHVRVALDQLENAGLIQRMEADRQLIMNLPLACVGSFRPEEVGPKKGRGGADLIGPTQTTEWIEKVQSMGPKKGRGGADLIGPTSGNQVSGKEKRGGARGKRLDVSDLPDDWRSYCAQKRADLNPDDVFEDFRDYWIAKPGQSGVKTDWKATWQRWVRNQRTPERREQPISAKQFPDRILQQGEW